MMSYKFPDHFFNRTDSRVTGPLISHAVVYLTAVPTHPIHSAATDDVIAKVLELLFQSGLRISSRPRAWRKELLPLSLLMSTRTKRFSGEVNYAGVYALRTAGEE